MVEGWPTTVIFVNVARSLSALIQNIIVEQGIKIVSRESKRRLERELYRSREASFPFVSADSFRALCDMVIEGGKVIYRAQNFKRRIIFCDASSFLGTEKEWGDNPNLALLRQTLQSLPEPPVVLLHNGDFNPQPQLLDGIANVAHWVFASNLVELRAKCTAVPVGLENRFRNRNGAMRDFLATREVEEIEDRPNWLFASFNVDNNRATREPLRHALSQSPYGFPFKRLSPIAYRREVLKSKFVLSPPGNGPDCHRTWEAIYLGAVPVLLEGYIASELAQDLPLITVRDYAPFLRLSKSSLQSLYLEVRRKSSRKAMMSHWVHEVVEKAIG